MKGIQLVGHGGFDKLVFKENIPNPIPKDDEVLIKVSAAGVNNTDINTRIGWYSKSVTANTNDGGEKGFESTNDKDATWSGNALKFPRIQGADICGKIVSVGKNVDQSRIDERVIVRSMQSDPDNLDKISSYVIGSEIDGGFAEYVAARSLETFKVNSNWSDVELASIPCAYSTAEGMLYRVELKDEKVLITGASGGVGSAAVQLAKRRGAYVVAQCSKSKFDEIKKIGADEVVDRDENLVTKLGSNEFDVTVDLVAGNNWQQLLDILKPGGRYVTAGAIAGPIVNLDVRTLYLKDLTFYGCTYQLVEVFKNLIKYIESNEIKPLVAKTFPLEQIVDAQKEFLSKKFIGKIVLEI
ncbi:alcohol dehydrogenase family protein [Candidatus Pelagibacter sp.]|uniref:alcohol dehydrogenase family protein n=1 Tax=Candidatus Pelagibacter sp. TaxID=2024849 RepID=UPI003F8715F0